MSRIREMYARSAVVRSLRAVTDPVRFVDALLDLYETRGSCSYEESVTQREHALQSAELADRTGADEALVVAALLHDVGHLLVGEETLARELPEEDALHEEQGADALAPWFGREVTEAIRLHVLAKRWLCATTPTYAAGLSAASRESLDRQGGALDAVEVERLGALPGMERALRLRRIDDGAKTIGASTRPLAAWRPRLLRVIRPERGSQATSTPAR